MPLGQLKDKSFDLGLIIGILLMAALIAVVARLDQAYFEMLVLADLWLLGYHHVIATYTKLAGTCTDRCQNFNLIWLLLPGVLVTTFIMGYLYGVISIVTIYFFWQWFHYVRQSWGIAQRYRHRSGPIAGNQLYLYQFTFWSVPVVGVLNRCYQNPNTFLAMPIWTPQVPLWLVQFGMLASACLVGWWLTTCLRAWKKGERALIHTVYMLSHFLIFFCGYNLIENISIGWLMVNVWHNTQYITFVRMHNQRRFSGGIAAEGLIISWLSQPGILRAAYYYGSCLLISTIIYYEMQYYIYEIVGKGFQLIGGSLEVSPFTFLILFSMGVNFHHYIVDGIIWKRKYEVRS